MTETPAPSAKAVSGAPAVESPPLAPDGTPLCYVVDEEPSIRHFLSLVLHGSGVDVVEYADGAAMRKAIETRAPALVFLNISLEVGRRDRIRRCSRQAAISRRCSTDECPRRGRSRTCQGHWHSAQIADDARPQETVRDRYDCQDHPGAQDRHAAGGCRAP